MLAFGQSRGTNLKCRNGQLSKTCAILTKPYINKVIVRGEEYLIIVFKFFIEILTVNNCC